MSTKPFVYRSLSAGKDETEYYLLSKEHVSVADLPARRY